MLIATDSVRSPRTLSMLQQLQQLEAKSANDFYINKKHAASVPVPRTYLIRNFT